MSSALQDQWQGRRLRMADSRCHGGRASPAASPCLAGVLFQTGVSGHGPRPVTAARPGLEGGAGQRARAGHAPIDARRRRAAARHPVISVLAPAGPRGPSREDLLSDPSSRGVTAQRVGLEVRGECRADLLRSKDFYSFLGPHINSCSGWASRCAASAGGTLRSLTRGASLSGGRAPSRWAPRRRPPRGNPATPPPAHRPGPPRTPADPRAPTLMTRTRTRKTLSTGSSAMASADTTCAGAARRARIFAVFGRSRNAGFGPRVLHGRADRRFPSNRPDFDSRENGSLLSVKNDNSVKSNEIPKILHPVSQKLDAVLPRKKSGQMNGKIWIDHSGQGFENPRKL